LLNLGWALAAEFCKIFNNIGGVFMVLSYCLSAGGDSEKSFRNSVIFLAHRDLVLARLLLGNMPISRQRN
jgi:hypothetical protein